ncbi:hypothetical protein HNY73_019861 [Argiope bruennichi]|uniref:Uncharacterized protein n=1 Tax=Argiope bruennichi TaxID=94029 RepID=A0A8T0E6D5_ARGBR|nr:hypothetical protein HNY73_019861 [Argiope bruennichi]
MLYAGPDLMKRWDKMGCIPFGGPILEAYENGQILGETPPKGTDLGAYAWKILDAKAWTDFWMHRAGQILGCIRFGSWMFLGAWKDLGLDGQSWMLTHGRLHHTHGQFLHTIRLNLKKPKFLKSVKS